jgi:hypothetical protein
MRVKAFFRFARDESGQSLPLVALAAVVLVGMLGMAVDLGRVWVAKQELQRAVDAASLAAGQDLPSSATAYSAAVAYSGEPGSNNPVGGWGVTAGKLGVTFECVSHGPDYTAGSTPTCLTDTSNDSCHPSNSSGSSNPPTPSGVTTCNAVNVTESVTVKTGLLNMFIPNFTVTASSTAAARGSLVPNPMNVFVIIDTTQSMTDSCSATVSGISNPTKLDCAKAGVRALLSAMEPCATNLTTCGSDVSGNNVANAADEVGLVVFPALSMTLTESNNQYSLSGPPASALADETNCGSNESFSVTYPPWLTYGNVTGDVISPPAGTIPTSGPSLDDDPNGDNYIGYEAVPLSSDYRTSDTSGLNLSSPLVDSVDWGESGCTSFPGDDDYGVKDIGGQGSYLAGAITEAQYLLSQTPARYGPNGQVAQNVIIILSDGELNSPKECNSTNQCPSTNNPYHDGVDPGASGNKGWTTTTQCGDAYTAAKEAQYAGTLIYTIGYDSSGDCTSPWTTTAQSLMQGMASSSSDYFNETDADDLTAVFAQVGSELSGDSALIPDCTQAPPNC